MAAATVALGTEAGHAATLAMKAQYAARRDFVVEQMRAAGFEVETPGGAFYVFAKIPSTHNQDDRAFALALAENAHVAVIPGSAFGQGGVEPFTSQLRNEFATLTEAMQRIKTYMQTAMTVGE